MLPNVLQPREADHVPVLAEEVRASLAVEPGETGHRRDLRRRRPRLAARGRPARQGEADRDRPRPDGADVLRAAREAHHREHAASAGRLRRRPAAAGGERRSRGRDPARSRRLLDAARPAGARVLVRRRRAARHAYGSDPGRERMRRRQPLERTRARDHLPPLRRGAVRQANRARDRPSPARAAVRAHRRARRHDQGGHPRAGAVRRGASGEAGLPGAADRGQRRARLARELRCRPRSRCCGRAVASLSSPSTRSRTGS